MVDLPGPVPAPDNGGATCERCQGLSSQHTSACPNKWFAAPKHGGYSAIPGNRPPVPESRGPISIPASPVVGSGSDPDTRGRAAVLDVLMAHRDFDVFLADRCYARCHCGWTGPRRSGVAKVSWPGTVSPYQRVQLDRREHLADVLAAALSVRDADQHRAEEAGIADVEFAMYEPSEYGRYVRHLRHESARFQAEYEDAAARLAETRGALIERTDERDVLQRQTEAALTLCDEMYETGYDIAEADPGSAVAFQLGRWSERLRAALSGVVDAQTEGKAEK